MSFLDFGRLTSENPPPLFGIESLGISWDSYKKGEPRLSCRPVTCFFSQNSQDFSFSSNNVHRSASSLGRLFCRFPSLLDGEMEDRISNMALGQRSVPNTASWRNGK